MTVRKLRLVFLTQRVAASSQAKAAVFPSVLLPLAKGHQKSHPSSRTSINFDNARSKIIIMSRHQDHPLRIHLVPPTGTRNWQEAIAFTCAMLVGCTFLDRRDAAVGETYNIGGNMERTNLEVVVTACDIIDELRPHAEGRTRDLIEFVPDRPGHDLRYAIDSTRIQEELGWTPKESFDSGLRKTVNWYLNNEWWWAPIRNAKYAGQRLGTISTSANAGQLDN